MKLFNHTAMNKEIIICAAVRHDNKVWRGHRHPQALAAMKDTLSYTMNRKEMMEQKVGEDQGFLTSTNRYVNRTEAAQIAREAGQITHKNIELYSEDLY